MTNSLKVVLTTLAIGLLSACQAENKVTPQAPQTPDVPSISSNGQEVSMTGYRSDDMEFMGLKAGMSFDEAVAKVTRFLKSDEPVEGNYKFSSETKVEEATGLRVTLITADGMLDDSVKATQVKLVSGSGTEANTLKHYGARIKCWRGENANKWRTQACS